MRLSYRRVATLPKLAWVADVDGAEGVVDVTCGPRVEMRPGWFVEGVWDGPFAAGGFHASAGFFGSGAVITADAVTFVPAADTVDCLYYAERGTTLHVSNSLALLLARTGDALDPRDTTYCAWLDSVLQGIDGHVATARTRDGAVHRLLYRNLRVSAAGVAIVDKPLPPQFGSYAEYVAYLEQAYAAIVRNARSEERATPLAIFSTQSRGYDTTAMNAIAARHGLDKVFTCTTARDKGAFVHDERTGQPSDDGTDIGRALGFACIPIDRLAFRTRFPDEELYFAGHHEMADANLRAVNDHVDDVAVLLSGVRGEVWYGEAFYRDREALGTDTLAKFDMAGHGLGELRLHVGLVLLPFPFLGARRQADIHAITRSPEMDAWRLRRDYDRPVPRRIAEERGVPRELFGQVKLNTTVAVPKPPLPVDPRLRAEFVTWLVRVGRLSRLEAMLLPQVHRVNQMIWYHSPRRYRALYYLRRLLSRLRRRPVELPLLYASLNGALFTFCVNRVAQRYAATLSTRERD